MELTLSIISVGDQGAVPFNSKEPPYHTNDGRDLRGNPVCEMALVV